MNNTRLPALLSAIAVTLLAAGCGESQLPVATGEADVRGINAIAGFGTVNFLIEERRIGEVVFKGVTRATYDDLSYTFNFELPLPGEPPVRIASRSVDFVRDTEYSFVLTGDAGAQEATVWQRPLRAWTGAETVFDVMIGHADATLGPVDVYVAAGGTDPVPGNALGSADFRQQTDPRDFEAGEYQITLTPAGDATTILYRSAPTNFPAAQSYLVTVFEADPGISGPVSVRVFTNGGATELPDERFPATAQFLNSSLTAGAIDVAIDGDYTDLAVSNLTFGAVSADVEVPTSASYQYAPAGTTTPLQDEDRSLVLGSTNLLILAGDASQPVVLQAAGFRRGISTVGRLRVTNTTFSFDAVDVYVVEGGTSVDDAFPSLFNFPFGFNRVLERPPGDYEISITEVGTKTVLAGPEPLPVDVFDVTEIVILDDTDPNAAGILTFGN